MRIPEWIHSILPTPSSRFSHRLVGKLHRVNICFSFLFIFFSLALLFDQSTEKNSHRRYTGRRSTTGRDGSGGWGVGVGVGRGSFLKKVSWKSRCERSSHLEYDSIENNVFTYYWRIPFIPNILEYGKSKRDQPRLPLCSIFLTVGGRTNA